MPGRLRTASRPSSTVMALAPYSPGTFRSFTGVSGCPTASGTASGFGAADAAVGSSAGFSGMASTTGGSLPRTSAAGSTRAQARAAART